MELFARGNRCDNCVTRHPPENTRVITTRANAAPPLQRSSWHQLLLVNGGDIALSCPEPRHALLNAVGLLWVVLGRGLELQHPGSASSPLRRPSAHLRCHMTRYLSRLHPDLKYPMGTPEPTTHGSRSGGGKFEACVTVSRSPLGVAAPVTVSFTKRVRRADNAHSRFDISARVSRLRVQPGPTTHDGKPLPALAGSPLPRRVTRSAQSRFGLALQFFAEFRHGQQLGSMVAGPCIGGNAAD